MSVCAICVGKGSKGTFEVKKGGCFGGGQHRDREQAKRQWNVSVNNVATAQTHATNYEHSRRRESALAICDLPHVWCWWLWSSSFSLSAVVVVAGGGGDDGCAIVRYNARQLARLSRSAW